MTLSERYVTGKDLTRRRGWTPHTIAQFLGEPDKRETKHFPGKSFTITLFSAARIEEAEENPEWQALAEGQYFLRRRAERTASRENAMDRVRNFDIKVRNSTVPSSSKRPSLTTTSAEPSFAPGKDWHTTPSMLGQRRHTWSSA